MNTAARLRRLKGLLVITSAQMRANKPELAMNTMALALENMDQLSPEDIDTGMMLDADLGDLLPHDTSTKELSDVQAAETFQTMMRRLITNPVPQG